MRVPFVWLSTGLALFFVGGGQALAACGPKDEVGPRLTACADQPQHPQPAPTAVVGKDAAGALHPDEALRKAGEKPTADGAIVLKHTTHMLPSNVGTDPGGQTVVTVPDTPSKTSAFDRGIRLRMTTSLRVRKGELDRVNLFGLDAAASAEPVAGPSIGQSMRPASRKTTELFFMPGAIHDASIRASILALSAITAKIHDATDSVPRVGDTFNTLGGNRSTVNGIIADLVSIQPQFPFQPPAVAAPMMGNPSVR